MSGPRATRTYPDWTRSYEGYISQIDERTFRIEREKQLFTLPIRFTMPAVGQYVQIETSGEGVVRLIRSRSSFRDRVIRANQEGLT